MILALKQNMILHFNRYIYEKYVYHADLCPADVEGRAVHKI